MHKTYKHHVVQIIMKNTIIITIEMVMPYSKTKQCTMPYKPTMYHTIYTNDVPYPIHQRCTTPYTPTMYHTIYTNDVPYPKHQRCTIPYKPTMNHTLYTNDVPYHINQRCTVPCTHPKPSGKPTSRHHGKPRIPNRRVNPTSRPWK